MKENKTTTKIANNIHIIRGQKVMFDKDLADLYDVEVRMINQAVKRNQKRFPEDFCFKLNSQDLEKDGSQSVIRDIVSTGNRTYPTVFTEQGAYALSFVLRSDQAIEMGLFIARAFTYLRRFILKNENLMMELKNNDHLSTTFSNFEKRIEQNLIVLYKNNTKYDKEIDLLKKRLDEVENKTKK
jgi:hypothetical protein